MTWCEDNGVFYCLGLARNERLGERLKTNFESLKVQIQEAKVETPCRSFTEFEYSTLNSWTKARRVIGKGEILPKGDNPRFIVTNLPKDGWSDPIQAARFEPAALYEKFYLCPWRHGKPHQRAANGSLCRSHQHPLVGFQPTAAVVLGLCASDHEHSAGRSFKGHRTRSCLHRSDSFTTL